MTHHKTRRWIDILDSITQSYNSTFHRSIKTAPATVTANDNVRLWKLQYDLKPKPSKRTPKEKTAFRFRFAPGDSVRISHMRSPFMREYEER